MEQRTQAEVEEERDVLTAEVMGAVSIDWGPVGNRGYRDCAGVSGLDGLSHTRQTIGPPVQDREGVAREILALVEDAGYPVHLIHRDNEKPPAWVVESQDGTWYFRISFRTTGTVITADTRCFPWDDDVDGPPLQHTTSPTPTPSATPPQ